MNDLTPLRAETLHQMEHGRVGAAIDLALKRIEADCRDRPGDDRARVLTVEIRVKPIADTVDREVVCDGLKATVLVKSKAPAQESREVIMGLDPRRGIVFSPDVLDCRQATFLQDEE